MTRKVPVVLICDEDLEIFKKTGRLLSHVSGQVTPAKNIKLPPYPFVMILKTTGDKILEFYNKKPR